MRPQPAADAPSLTPPPSSPALLNRIDFFFCRDASAGSAPYRAPKTLTQTVVTITGAARSSSGKQGEIIAQAKSVKVTPDAPSQLRRYWTGAWALTDWLLSPRHSTCSSFLFFPATMEGKWGCFGGKAIRKTSCKSVWKSVFFFFF